MLPSGSTGGHLIDDATADRWCKYDSTLNIIKSIKTYMFTVRHARWLKTNAVAHVSVHSSVWCQFLCAKSCKNLSHHFFFIQAVNFRVAEITWGCSKVICSSCVYVFGQFWTNTTSSIKLGDSNSYKSLSPLHSLWVWLTLIIFWGVRNGQDMAMSRTTLSNI